MNNPYTVPEIVATLREYAADRWANPNSKDLYRGAAAAIENLRAENARLREALSGLMNEYGGTRALPYESPRAEAARAALEVKP
jgi:hypothetical protein